MFVRLLHITHSLSKTFFLNNHLHQEHNIIKRQVDREQEWSLGLSSSREELQQNVLARMKSVTNASEDVCVSLLEENSYDLKTSIETYLYNSAF